MDNMKSASDAFKKILDKASPDQVAFLKEIREWIEAWYVEVGIRGLFHILLGH